MSMPHLPTPLAVSAAAAPSSVTSAITLTLRPLQPSDAAAFHTALSDAECMRYWSHLPYTSMQQTEAWVQRMMAAAADGSSDERAVIDSHSGELLGKVCLLTRADGDRELGVLVLPKHWRRGIARLAVSVMIGEAFSRPLPEDEKISASSSTPNATTSAVQTRPHWIHADVDPRNEASLALLRSLGFVQFDSAHRTFQLGAEWVDSAFLRVNKEQFDGATAAR
jgi:RimJ/RimL family protein N-acetyltransferase